MFAPKLPKPKLSAFSVAFSLLLFSTASFGQAPQTTETDIESESLISEEEAEYIQWSRSLLDSMEPQTGKIEISEANAVLHVPENFYYLNPRDAEKVLAEVWGNPPGQPTLGLLFPADKNAFDDDSWAVSIEYEEDGYVSDKDAHEIDYDDMLQQMKDDTQQASEARVEQGYEAIELIGWAAQPYYDANAHKLHWAKEIKFGDQSINTLNYDIRVLGRKGVLILSFIAGIDQKAVIESNLDTVLALAEFEQGQQYADFNPDTDKLAAYGIGALVAGKLAMKTGLLAAALIFLKKFGIIIVIGIGALFKKLFSKKKPENTDTNA